MRPERRRAQWAPNFRDWIVGTVVASVVVWCVAATAPSSAGDCGMERLGLAVMTMMAPDAIWKWDGETLWLSPGALAHMEPDGDGGAWVVP